MAISLLLTANNMTRRDFAARINESEFWLGRRLNSVSEFKINDLDKIAKVFGLTLDALLELPNAIPTIHKALAA